MVLVGLGLLLGLRPAAALASDSKSSTSLEDYFTQLGYETVTFEPNEHRQPFIVATLDNGHKRKLLVDTGWGISTLDEKAARGLKRVGELGGVLQDSLSGPITNKNIAVMEKLVLGRAQFFNQPARVEQLRADYVTVPFDGVLGCDFLVRNFCLVDCWKNCLYVRSAKLTEGQRKTFEESLRLSGFREISLEGDGLLTVEAHINAGAVRLLVDTGAAFDELDDSEVKPLGLTLLRYERAPTGSYIAQDVTGGVVGLGKVGRHPVHVTRLESLQMGPCKWKGVYFGVVDLSGWGLAKPRTRNESLKGFLSMAFLHVHGALIDVGERKIWLRPERP